MDIKPQPNPQIIAPREEDDVIPEIDDHGFAHIKRPLTASTASVPAHSRKQRPVGEVPIFREDEDSNTIRPSLENDVAIFSDTSGSGLDLSAFQEGEETTNESALESNLGLEAGIKDIRASGKKD